MSQIINGILEVRGTRQVFGSLTTINAQDKLMKVIVANGIKGVENTGSMTKHQYSVMNYKKISTGIEASPGRQEGGKAPNSSYLVHENFENPFQIIQEKASASFSTFQTQKSLGLPSQQSAIQNSRQAATLRAYETISDTLLGGKAIEPNKSASIAGQAGGIIERIPEENVIKTVMEGTETLSRKTVEKLTEKIDEKADVKSKEIYLMHHPKDKDYRDSFFSDITNTNEVTKPLKHFSVKFTSFETDEYKVLLLAVRSKHLLGKMVIGDLSQVILLFKLLNVPSSIGTEYNGYLFFVPYQDDTSNYSEQLYGEFTFELGIPEAFGMIHLYDTTAPVIP